MSWSKAFVTTLGPGYFGGTTPSVWLRVLRENEFSVDSPYWPRAMVITLGSFQNALLAGWENLVYGRRVRDVTIYPPLFVLGIFRSGTTLLHNLLAQDDRFAYPNVYQTCYPKTFLRTESTNSRVVGFFLPDRRPQDGIALGMRETQEEEFALCSLTGRNMVMGWVFPRRAGAFEGADPTFCPRPRTNADHRRRADSFEGVDQPLGTRSLGHSGHGCWLGASAWADQPVETYTHRFQDERGVEFWSRIMAILETVEAAPASVA
jgi:hypothetical protein